MPAPDRSAPGPRRPVTATVAGAGTAPADHSGAIVFVLSVAGITAALMQTLVIPLIGDLPRLLDTSATNASWVITATLLTGAVATPVTGRLGDLHGKRRLMLVCGGILVAGSLVCALASSVGTMVVGRGLQGVGMGLIPLGISAMRDLLPAHRLGPSIALMSSSMGIGGALGLPAAAAVAEHTSWRVLFWASTALAVLIVAMVWTMVPRDRVITRPATTRFDLPGSIGLGIGLVCLLLPVSKGGDWGWTSGTTLGLFGASVLTLLAWGWFELRTRDPLVDLRVTARPVVLLTNAASVVVGFGMYAQSLIVPQLLQLPEATGHGLGQSMLAMGLWMAPGGFVMTLVSPMGARISAARGPRTTLVVGALALATGYALVVLLMGSTWGLMAAVCVCSAGVGLTYGAMPALIMGAVPVSETASANSFNTLMRSIGTSVAAAVVGVVLAQMTTDLGGLPVPSEAGFRTGLLIGCGVALVAAAVAALIPTDGRPVAERPARAAHEPVPTARP